MWGRAAPLTAAPSVLWRGMGRKASAPPSSQLPLPSPSPLSVDRSGTSTLITITAKPSAKKSAINAFNPEGVAIALAAPPAEGAANTELVALLAEVLGVRKGALSLLSGARGRRKVVAVAGLDPGRTEQLLRAAL